eukprot:1161717-Pelagomonas_calceolata.AAC.5
MYLLTRWGPGGREGGNIAGDPPRMAYGKVIEGEGRIRPLEPQMDKCGLCGCENEGAACVQRCKGAT